MAWLSRVNFISSDTLSFTDINNLGNDIRAWGDNVNGGGYTLSNVVVSASSGTMATVTGGTGAASTLTIRSTSGAGTTDAIVFQTASQSERMRITSGGNVGIGTASPSNKLTVLTTGTLNTAGDFIDVGATFTGADYAFGAGGNPAILNVHSNSTLGAGVGATIGLGGRYTGTSFGQFAIIKGAKENATDGNFATFLAFGTRANGGNITERMRIDSSGNVGIGTSSPQGKLAIGNYTIINALDGGSASSDIGNNLRFDGANWRYLNTGAASLLQFTAGDTKIFTAPSGTGGNIATLTERMQITNGGNVGIGALSPAYQLQLSTDSAAKPTTNTWTIASDARLKVVKGEYQKGLAEICQVRPVRYEYNGKAGFTADSKEQISILAQELMQVFPECVDTFKGKLEEDGPEIDLYNYNGHAITFALINAIKELKAKIDILEARN